MITIHPKTGFPIADSGIDPLEREIPPTTELEADYQQMVISASGWRKIFSASNDEEDEGDTISRTEAYIIALATEAFYRERRPNTVILAMDTRPTGPAIADIVCRILISHGVHVKHLFIAAAPEIMAYSFYHADSDFFYITASHNPIGHNGFKFGKDGGVAKAEEATKVIATFRTLLADPEAPLVVKELSSSVPTEIYDSILDRCTEEKEQAEVAYERLVLDIATNSEDEAVFGDMIADLRHDIAHLPIGIVGELNGSARALSIDREFLDGLGVRTRFLNDRPREIAHAIVPEGENLQMCRRALEEAHKEDPSFMLGYVPDNDGDRGNIVYYDEGEKKAKILGAQQLFALVARIELSLAKKEDTPLAIVVNGPTSLMIDTIAANLGATVFRAEVGEANVVSLAEEARSQGYMVRILGEGSNGGNITHPGKVRDPLNTLVSLIKLLSSPERFSAITGRQLEKSEKPSIAKAIATLPARTITGGFSKEAVMKIETHDHGKLKSAYEKLFVTDYANRRGELEERFGISGWREEQTEGTRQSTGLGPDFRNPPMRGGLKIIFSDRLGTDTDFIWMRGSGTEPVYRIMADAMGNDQKRHDYLLAWQRDLVRRADMEAVSEK